MQVLRHLALGFRTSWELVGAMARGRYWWLVPIVAFMLPLALLFVFLQTVSWAAPFVYTLF